MAKSSCSKCGTNAFEAISQKISGLNTPFLFVQCSNCGTVVSAVVAGLKQGVDDIRDNLDELNGEVSSLTLTVSDMEESLKTWSTKVGAAIQKIAKTVGGK